MTGQLQVPLLSIFPTSFISHIALERLFIISGNILQNNRQTTNKIFQVSVKLRNISP